MSLFNFRAGFNTPLQSFLLVMVFNVVAGHGALPENVDLVINKQAAPPTCTDLTASNSLITAEVGIGFCLKQAARIKKRTIGATAIGTATGGYACCCVVAGGKDGLQGVVGLHTAVSYCN